MTRIIMLNGPRRVGKDHIASAFVDEVASARILPIMWPVKVEALQTYGLPADAAKWLEHTKDEPHAMLGGKTPREVYIEYGTELRDVAGEGIIAQRWVETARTLRGYGYLVVPDVRFQPEVDAAKREFGTHNVLLIRVRRDGHDWTDDIGSYCTHMFAHDFDNTPQSTDVGIELLDVVKRMMF